MDVMPNEEKDSNSEIANAKKTEKKVRRKCEHKDSDSKAHVVVTTTPLKPKPVKPESKKLRRKLHEFEQENVSLAKSISEKNNEINALKKSVDSLNDVLNSVPIDELRCNSSIASTKILELSKKNRQMRAELEQFKNRMSKKDLQIEKLTRELKSAEEKFQQNEDVNKKAPIAEEMQSKISSMQQKLFETRNKNVELQNQLKLAQKCLQHEIGENVNINKLFLNQSQSNWRGRAQQILALQQKLVEMRQRLEIYEARMTDRPEYLTPVTIGSDVDLASQLKSSNTSLGGSPKTSNEALNVVATFDRFAPGVRKSELQHRAKVEALEKEIAGLNEQLEEHRNKMLALKVRNKTLSDEMLKLKQKSYMLEEQTDYNGVNMQSMNEKLNKQRHQYENRLDDVRSDLIKVTEERDIAMRQLTELSNKNLELETASRESETLSLQLQEMVKKLETDLRAVSGGFLFSCREFRKEEFVSILDALEVEKNQLMLHNKKLSERLSSEREKQEASADQMSKQKQRISRLEAKIRDLEKELDTQSERKKRTQRMAEYANSLSRTSINSSVSSFSFDNQSLYSSAQTLNQGNETKLEELKNQLELANEKIVMLNEKVEYLTEEKQSDAKFFEETMMNSKTIILDTIVAQRNPGKVPSSGSVQPTDSRTEFTSDDL